jgi:hypothetical protein
MEADQPAPMAVSSKCRNPILMPTSAIVANNSPSTIVRIPDDGRYRYQRHHHQCAAYGCEWMPFEHSREHLGQPSCASEVNREFTRPAKTAWHKMSMLCNGSTPGAFTGVLF